MAKNLLIVESPAKAKTIKKFLGAGYEVVASVGHVRDLPKSTMGIDVENDFEPKYITIRGKGDVLTTLRKEVKKADKIYLATDPDREGEAISWHLKELLKLDDKNSCRISFNEITKNAVRNSIKNARGIDMNLVDAQQARRVLDRMVGYKISPVLWAKVKSGLSAGRVQSVALKIISEREAEIAGFVPDEYWTINAELTDASGKHKVLCAFHKDMNDNSEIGSGEQAEKIVSAVKNSAFSVKDIKHGEKKRKSPLPFTTSTLQQEASKQLNFSTQKTMSVAQQLYEGVDVKGHGTIGLITYLRTDSVRISEEADQAARKYIASAYTDAYVADTPTGDKSGKKIQDAHEAIRPSYIDITPAEVKDSLTREQYRLYQLIWKRFIASRMQPAVYDTMTVHFESNGCIFVASHSKLVFDGFMSVYKPEEEAEGDNNKDLSWITAEQSLKAANIIPEQHFTQAPPHFNEASLVKTLEELGIGRPSTYAPTITTIIARHYVAKENRNLYMTELGDAVNAIMNKSFPSIVDVNFTATMEGLLDAVGEGEIAWKTVIRNFYPDLIEAVAEAEKDLEKVKIRDEETDVVCDLCGRNMVIKYGPHGKFLACPGFPECRNTKPFNEKTGITCPKCGGDILIMKTKKGRRFYGCSNHPNCDYMSWNKPDPNTK